MEVLLVALPASIGFSKVQLLNDEAQLQWAAARQNWHLLAILFYETFSRFLEGIVHDRIWMTKSHGQYPGLVRIRGQHFVACSSRLPPVSPRLKANRLLLVYRLAKNLQEPPSKPLRWQRRVKPTRSSGLLRPAVEAFQAVLKGRETPNSDISRSAVVCLCSETLGPHSACSPHLNSLNIRTLPVRPIAVHFLGRLRALQEPPATVVDPSTVIAPDQSKQQLVL